ncbi:uncharacterized protein EI90DRAFT_3117565 [Cantharellus anzutake]|uniref:uncharacterized protein n=1 Tax=Cantharellus anzutake TaxID=1750568 RepID=UPI001907EFF9|nr:uncharacterized protein EI90DRAFT_3117565 [Cantharellus anzutake]KAF8339801.1 hypothetical protein EI90DRAFT_3117565 [Cantharellus anzutake]
MLLSSSSSWACASDDSNEKGILSLTLRGLSTRRRDPLKGRKIFPFDIICHLLQYCDPTTQRAIALLNRDCYAATHQYLWNHVVVRPFHEAKRPLWPWSRPVDLTLSDLVVGLQNIARDPNRARWIRFLSIRDNTPATSSPARKRSPSQLGLELGCSDHDKDKVEISLLLLKALSQTIRLSRLDLSSFTCFPSDQLADAITPPLVSGSLQLSFLGVPFGCWPYLLPALTCQPSIRHLLLTHPKEFMNTGTADMPPLPFHALPHLESLAVPICNLTSITNGRPLHALRILGAPHGYPSTTPWHSDSMLRGFQSIAFDKSNPGLMHLELPFTFISEFIEDESEFGDDITALLRHLAPIRPVSNLQRLDICCGDRVRFPVVREVPSNPEWLGGDGNRGALPRLMRALSLFEDLDELRWNCSHANVMKGLCTGFDGTGPCVNTSGQWEGFARACSKANSKLQRVYINGELVPSK